MTKCVVHRKALLEALEAVKRVIWSHGVKEVLKCVHLQVVDGQLEVWATDLEVAMKLFVPAEGELDACLVNHAQLLARVKKGSAQTCSIGYSYRVCEKEKVEWVEAAGGTEKKVTMVPAKADMEVYVNGGKVGHKLYGVDPDEYPSFGQTFEDRAEASVEAQELRQFIDINLKAVARENTRYAINGVLLQMEGEKRRMVATDGRRLVITRFATLETEATDVHVVAPSKAVTLVKSLIDKKDRGRIGIQVGYTTKEPKPGEDGLHKPGAEPVREAVQVCFIGDGWIVKSLLVEGHFPDYHEVIPRETNSVWRIDREALAGLLDEVSVTCTEYNKAVHFWFHPECLNLYARSPEIGESEGQIAASFDGIGPNEIEIGFNPAFVKDILATTDVDTVTVKLASPERPGIFDGNKVEWIVMPVNISGSTTSRTEAEAVAIPA